MKSKSKYLFVQMNMFAPIHKSENHFIFPMTVAKSQKKVTRKIIKIDEDLCTGCGKCVISCAEGALAIVDGKAKVISEVFCDGLGACIGECPEGALTIEEREAYEFDEEAVVKHLEQIGDETEGSEDTAQPSSHNSTCNCPSSAPLVFNEPWEDSSEDGEIKSALRQWPTKLTLVNPNAPYFDREELIIVSDCSPVAYGDFHRKILKGKPLVTVCPMLSLGEAELNKLEEILKSNPIKTLKLILMEVPCCQKIKLFLDPILDQVERPITVEEIIISRDGQIKRSETIS